MPGVPWDRLPVLQGQMIDPKTAFSAILLAGSGVGAGLAYAVAAVESDLHPLPSLEKMYYALTVAIVGAVLKSYVPSKKQTTSEFEFLKSQHAHMNEKLEAVVTTMEEVRNRRQDTDLELQRWMGRIESKLDDTWRRLDAVESSVHRRSA